MSLMNAVVVLVLAVVLAVAVEAGGPRVHPANASSVVGARVVPDIALFTIATDGYEKIHHRAIRSKDCYARRHGYTFVLETGVMDHGRSQHWNRLFAARQLLQEYTWVVYMDADAFVTNSNVRLESFIDGVSPTPDMIVQDGMGINSGAIMFRRSAWTLAFLDRWWALGGLALAEQRRGGVIFDHDQVGLWEALLEHAQASRDSASVPPVGPCFGTGVYDSDDQKNGGGNRLLGCWLSKMAALGFPFRHRSTDHVRYWVQSNHPGRPRGFNMFNGVGNSFNAAYYPPEAIWFAGDFVLHNINAVHGDVSQSPDLVTLFGASGCPDSHWTVRHLSVTCGGGGGGGGGGSTTPCSPHPTLDELWRLNNEGTSVSFGVFNSWAGYTPLSPGRLPPVTLLGVDPLSSVSNDYVYVQANSIATKSDANIRILANKQNTANDPAAASDQAASPSPTPAVWPLHVDESVQSRILDLVLLQGLTPFECRTEPPHHERRLACGRSLLWQQSIRELSTQRDAFVRLKQQAAMGGDPVTPCTLIVSVRDSSDDALAAQVGQLSAVLQHYSALPELHTMVVAAPTGFQDLHTPEGSVPLSVVRLSPDDLVQAPYTVPVAAIPTACVLTAELGDHLPSLSNVRYALATWATSEFRDHIVSFAPGTAVTHVRTHPDNVPRVSTPLSHTSRVVLSMALGPHLVYDRQFHGLYDAGLVAEHAHAAVRVGAPAWHAPSVLFNCVVAADTGHPVIVLSFQHDPVPTSVSVSGARAGWTWGLLHDIEQTLYPAQGLPLRLTLDVPIKYLGPPRVGHAHPAPGRVFEMQYVASGRKDPDCQCGGVAAPPESPAALATFQCDCTTVRRKDGNRPFEADLRTIAQGMQQLVTQFPVSWTPPAHVMESALDYYGIPTNVQPIMNDPRDVSVAAPDVLCLIAHMMGEGTARLPRYLEIGVSLGKTFFQVTHGCGQQFSVAIAADIEVMSPALMHVFGAPTRAANWESVPPSYLDTFPLPGDGGGVAAYARGSEHDPRMWEALSRTILSDGRGVNVVYSDCVHDGEGLLAEARLLLDHGMLDSVGGYTILYDDMGNLDIGSTYAAMMRGMRSRVSGVLDLLKADHPDVRLYTRFVWLSGWLGAAAPAHLMFIVSTDWRITLLPADVNGVFDKTGGLLRPAS